MLAPHTDDGEIGAGALIAKMVEDGAECRYVAFSACEESVPEEFPQDVLRKEVLVATSELGIESDKVEILSFPVRRFSEYRQAILDHMISVRRAFGPDLVLSPSSNDIHQDHTVVYQEAMRAFKACTLLGYDMPWNCIEFRSDLVVRVSEEQLSKKVLAIQAYKSQGFRDYTSEPFIVNLARLRAVATNAEFAEAYEVLRWVW